MFQSIPAAEIQKFNQLKQSMKTQKKLITSARFRGLMFSVEISSLWFALDVIVKSIVLGSKLLIKRSQMLKILCDALKKLVLYQHKPIRGLKT